MKISRRVFYFLLIIGLITQQASGQQTKTTIYKGDKFTLEYPSQWQTTNENGTLNFFPKENFASVTFSYQSGIDFPLPDTRRFILDMYELNDKPGNVKMTKTGDIIEFSYEHIEDNVKWVTKVFRKKTDFYLLTINCDLNKWSTNREALLKVINSFKLI